jgi:uncharacterized protein YxeA
MYLIILILILVIILLLLIYYNKNRTIIDSFDNLENNLYTYDSCCSEKQKQHCMTYGKTGECNYNKNDKSCFCQNAY